MSSVFSPKSVIVQGITGTHGSFHTKMMLDYGTHIIGGTSPNKAGEQVHGVPVYASVKDLLSDGREVDASVIFVPARFAKAAIFEAIEAAIPLIVCVTEGIPIHDMLAVRKKLINSNSRLIGPNSPGILTPGEAKLGIIPATITLPGSVAIVSRSGTLTYEVVSSLTKQSIGQRYIIGIGGDPINGLGFVECLKAFEEDASVSSIILIGEVGGEAELSAAEYIKQHVTKPVAAYVAGHYAPKNIQLGHAGAILGSDKESATTKSLALSHAGAIVTESITDIAQEIKRFAL